MMQLPGATVDPCHHYDKSSCADPTFTTKCPNAAQACSAYKELDACAASPPPAGTTCAQVYYQNHKAQMDAVPTVRRIEPSRNSLATQSKSMHFVPYDRSKVTVGGMDHSFSARLASPSLVATRAVQRAAVRPPHLTFLQAAMKKVGPSGPGSSANTPIDSCDEYGARKYLSLTQFDADVNAASRDPRAAYGLIYSPKWSSIVAKAQITDSEGQTATTPPTAAFDSQGNVVEVPSTPLTFDTVQHPRNEFALVSTSFNLNFVMNDGKHGPQDMQAPLPAFGINTYSGTPAVGNAITNWQKSNQIYFNQELFGRRPFPPTDSPTITETFAWHKTKNDALWEDA